MDDLIKCCLHFTKESNIFTYRVKLSRYKFISKVINLLTPQSYKLKKAPRAELFAPGLLLYMILCLLYDILLTVLYL